MSFQNTTVLANGLSDFHKMAVTDFKLKFEKNKPKEVTYRDYKNFDENSFKTDLKTAFSSGCDTYGEFEKTILSTLNLHAPYKKKYIRANHDPYMTKTLSKAIMRRSQLQSKYFKTKKKKTTNFLKSKEILSVNYIRKKRKSFMKIWT